MVAHELESSLIAVSTNAELLRRAGPELSLEQEDRLAGIERTADRMKRLLTSMKNLAQATIEIEPVPLDEVVEEVRETLLPLAAGRQAEIVSSGPLPTVLADRNQTVSAAPEPRLKRDQVRSAALGSGDSRRGAYIERLVRDRQRSRAGDRAGGPGTDFRTVPAAAGVSVAARHGSGAGDLQARRREPWWLANGRVPPRPRLEICPHAPRSGAGGRGWQQRCGATALVAGSRPQRPPHAN